MKHLYGPPSSRLVIVGQAINRTCKDPSLAITGRCGKALARFAGVEATVFYTHVRRANVLDYFPGETDSGAQRFPLKEARRSARELAALIPAGSTVVLLGRRVAEAFGAGDLGWLERARAVRFYDRGPLYLAPHPSGLSRMLTDPYLQSACTDFWTSLVGAEILRLAGATEDPTK